MKMLMMHGICLSELRGIHLNLRRLVMFLNIHVLMIVHSILDLIMLIFGVVCVIVLTMKLICVLIMHVMCNLTLHHPETILMLV